MVEQPKSMRAKDIAEQTASGIPSNFQEAFARVVQAGMKVMFSEQTHDVMLDALQGEGDIAEKVGSAVADLMTLLYMKSNKTMPGEVIVPAGLYLLSQGVDFMEQVTGEEIDTEVIADASDVMITKLAEKFGISQDKFQAGLMKVGEVAAAEEPEGEEPEGEEPEMEEEEA